MKERHAVMIPEEIITKIKEIEALRPDIKGYILSKQVFVLLQESIKANLNNISPRAKIATYSNPILKKLL